MGLFGQLMSITIGTSYIAGTMLKEKKAQQKLDAEMVKSRAAQKQFKEDVELDFESWQELLSEYSTNKEQREIMNSEYFCALDSLNGDTSRLRLPEAVEILAPVTHLALNGFIPPVTFSTDMMPIKLMQLGEAGFHPRHYSIYFKWLDRTINLHHPSYHLVRYRSYVHGRYPIIWNVFCYSWYEEVERLSDIPDSEVYKK